MYSYFYVCALYLLDLVKYFYLHLETLIIYTVCICIDSFSIRFQGTSIELIKFKYWIDRCFISTEKTAKCKYAVNMQIYL